MFIFTYAYTCMLRVCVSIHTNLIVGELPVSTEGLIDTMQIIPKV